MENNKISDAALRSNLNYYNALISKNYKVLTDNLNKHNRTWDKLHLDSKNNYKA